MTDGELAQCLQKLRLIFEGFKAGGLRDWAYRSQTTRDVIQRAAACQTGEQQLTLISNELTG
ncbi:MAG: hypothetical protein ACLQBD_27235 [Syntrophobacteraceae bacterium]